MIYLPSVNGSCVVILNSDTVRLYHENVVLDADVSYTDYFVNSHYMYSEGTENIKTMPICQNMSNYTTDIKYRNDFSDIALLTAITCIFVFGIPLIIVSRFFKRFR